MKVEVRPFGSVFDGTANFVPRAILDLHRQPLPAVARLMDRIATEGEDGVDSFRAVPMVLVLEGGHTRRFALWRHAGNPAGQVAIQFPLDEEFDEALAGVMATLHIPDSALVWRDEPVQAAHPA